MNIFKKVRPGDWIFFIFLIFVWLSFFLLAAGKDALDSKLSEWKLIPQKDTFTELYFDDRQPLPKIIESGKPFSFSFVIHNAQGRAQTYHYDAYLARKNAKYELLISDDAIVESGNYEKVRVTGVVLLPGIEGKIVVILPALGQQIIFYYGK